MRDLLAPPVSGQWHETWGLLLALLLVVAIGVLPLKAALAVIAGGAALLLTAIDPVYGLAALALAVPYGDLAQLSVGGFAVGGTEVITTAVAIAFVGWLSRHGGERWPWPLGPTAVFFGFVAFSATLAPNLGLGLKEGLKGLELMVAFAVAASVARTRRDLAIVVGALVVAAVAEAALGWYQFIGHVGPTGFLLSEGVLRAYGSFGQPNPYAGYIGLSIPLLFGLLLAKALPEKGGWLLAGALALLVGALVMSFSRGAWLAFAGMAAVVLAAHRPRWAPAMVGIGIVGVAVLAIGAFDALPSVISGRLASLTQVFSIVDIRRDVPTDQNWAVFERMVNWQAAWDMFQANPWLGVGLGNFGVFFEQFALPPWRNYTGHAHNYYLNLLAEGGAIGLALYAIMMASWLALLASVIRRRRTGDDALGYGVALGALGAVVALSLHNVFDNLYVHGMSVQVGLLLGLAASATRERP